MRTTSALARLAALSLVVLAVALAWLGSRTEPERAPDPSTAIVPETTVAPATRTRAIRDDTRPDILLITIEALRADHVWSYGASRHTTPTLTTLAASGTQFDVAYSASSWTAPAVTSLLTGVIPSQHGVRQGFWLDRLRVAGQETVSTELPTLAALLHDAGYLTIGVTANTHLTPALGFDRGFDTYASFDFSATASVLAPEIERHLDQLADSASPYFLWIHLVDPHAPFEPRRPVFDTWYPPTEPQYPILDACPLDELLPVLFRRQHIPADRGLAYVTAAYDSEIHAADAYVGDLLRRLDHDTLAVVVTADHGEELGEHLRFGHGHTAFEESVRVPLVFRVPGDAMPHGRTIPTPVSLVDVMPTLLEIAGVTAPAGIAGRSLLAGVTGADVSPRDIVIETGRGRERVRAIVSEHFKYGARTTPTPVLEGLFDLEADPRELHNLLSEQPERAATLRARLDAIVDAASAVRPPTSVVPIELTEQDLAQLRALGYAN